MVDGSTIERYMLTEGLQCSGVEKNISICI